VPGGILIGNAALYDTLSRLLIGPLVMRIAADVATVALAGAQILEVNCGPGQLSIRLARHHGLEVTGLDLDPAMITRANTNRPETSDQHRPEFLVGDVAALAFPDRSFDLVVSTLSMHHWADPAAGLAETGRVLRPGARTLIWDFRPASATSVRTTPRAHARSGGPHTCSPLRVENATPWRWPWRFALTQRVELIRADA
jgi:ubiquinone/menaquinone biosynthesis C-methylase UbiE